MGFKQGSIKQGKADKISQDSSNSINNNKPYIMVPYIKGMSESCKNICRKHGIEMHFQVGSTIKDLMVHPMDKDTILQKTGVIYRYKCGRVDCGEYIKESGRTFVERFREYMMAPSCIHDNHNTTGSWPFS